MREGTTGATSGGVGARHGDRIGVDSGAPTSPSDSSLPATSDGTREGLESLQGGVCLTRGMKVLLRVGQSEWGWGTPPRGRGSLGQYHHGQGAAVSTPLSALPRLQVPEEGLPPESLCLKCPWKKTEGWPTAWSLGRRTQQVGTRGPASCLP